MNKYMRYAYLHARRTHRPRRRIDGDDLLVACSCQVGHDWMEPKTRYGSNAVAQEVGVMLVLRQHLTVQIEDFDKLVRAGCGENGRRAVHHHGRHGFSLLQLVSLHSKAGPSTSASQPTDHPSTILFPFSRPLCSSLLAGKQRRNTKNYVPTEMLRTAWPAKRRSHHSTSPALLPLMILFLCKWTFTTQLLCSSY